MKKSIARSERGFGVVGIIIVVVVIAAVGVVGWKVSHKSTAAPVSKAVAAADNATEAACLKVYNDKDLCKFAASAGDFATTAYTAVDTSTDTSGATSTATISSDGKGDTQVSSSTGGQTYAAITIGNNTYIKEGSATTWLEYSAASSPTSNPASSIKPDFSASSTPAAQRIQYKKIDSEKCGDLTCLKYQIIDPSTPSTTTYAWFDTTNYRLQEWQSTGSTGTNDFKITYTSVKISVPSPVTDESTSSSTPSSTSGSSSTSLTPAEQAEVNAAEKAAGQ